MRVLFITEQFPYPLDTGGNVRTFNLLRGLAQEHEVTLLATHVAELPTDHVRVVAELCHNLRVVRRARAGPIAEAVTLVRSLVSATPFVLLRHSASAVHREIRALFQARPDAFDAVHFNHLDAVLYDRSIPADLLRIIDEHNVVANQVKTTLPTETRPIHKMILRHELAKLTTLEARVCNGMDMCLVCSDSDQMALREIGVMSPTVIVPNGADLDYFVPAIKPAVGNLEIVFVGTLDYDPCEKAVWYFCTEILPLLRRQMPDIRFVAIGRNPSARLRFLAVADEAVVLTGRVEDIRPHVHHAGAFVVPLLSGSGTRLKIIEAMAMGVPVVSTTIGAEGIAGVDGVHLRIADTPQAFADAVAQVLSNPEQAGSLSRAARRLVDENYGWPAIRRTLLSAYAAAARRSRPVGSSSIRNVKRVT